MPQASASTQTLASPSETVGRTVDVGGGEQAGKRLVRPDAEEADPVAEAAGAGEPLQRRPLRAVAGQDQGRAGNLRKRHQRELLALARDQRAGADEQRPGESERRLGGRPVDRPEAVEIDAGAVDADLLLRKAERDHVALQRLR